MSLFGDWVEKGEEVEVFRSPQIFGFQATGECQLPVFDWSEQARIMAVPSQFSLSEDRYMSMREGAAALMSSSLTSRANRARLN